MKKLLYSFCAVFVMAFSLASLTSCGDDNDDNPSAEQSTESTDTLTAVRTLLFITPTDDLLKYGNVTLECSSSFASTKSFDVDSTKTVAITCHTKNFPATVTAKVTCTQDNSVTPADDEHLSVGVSVAAKRYNMYSNGNLIEAKNNIDGMGSIFSINGNKLNDWFKNDVTNFVVYITIDKDGNSTHTIQKL